MLVYAFEMRRNSASDVRIAGVRQNVEQFIGKIGVEGTFSVSSCVLSTPGSK
jgi:hypothetical protein